MLEKLPLFRFIRSPMLGFTSLTVPYNIKEQLYKVPDGDGWWEGNTLYVPDGGRQGLKFDGDGNWYNVNDFDTPGQGKRGETLTPRAVMMDGKRHSLAWADQNSNVDGKPGVPIRQLAGRLIYHGLRRGK